MFPEFSVQFCFVELKANAYFEHSKKNSFICHIKVSVRKSGKFEVNFKFTMPLDLNKCLKQIKLTILLPHKRTCF